MSPLLERLLKLLLTVIGVPDWTDSAAVRAWFQKMLGLAAKVAEWTPTTADDVGVQWVAKVVNDDALWPVVYSILVDIFGLNDDATSLAKDSRVAKLADDTKMDPATIIAIIMAIYNVWKWWKTQNQQ